MSKSLGVLTLDLVARTAGFVQGMSKAERESAKWRRSVQRDMKEIQKQAKNLGVAVAAGVTAGAVAMVAMVNASRQTIDEQAKLARALGGTIAGMDALARAGGRAGVSTEELRNASQRLNQALGTAIQKGGPAADSLRRLGLDAKALSRMDVDQRFAAIANRMTEMGLSTQIAAAELRALGIRQSSVITLMQEGGAAIEDSRRKLLDYGVTLSEIDAAKVEQMNDSLDELSIISSGFSKQLTVQFAPVIQLVTDLMAQAAIEAGGMGNVAENAFNRIITASAFVVDAADGIKRAFTITADVIIGVMVTAHYRVLEMVAGMAEAINRIPGVDIDTSGMRESAKEARRIAAEASNNIKQTLERPLAGTAFKQLLADAQAASEATAKATVAAREGAEVAYDAIEDGAKEAIKAQEQLEKAFESAAASYHRQIALFGDTTEAQNLMYDIQYGKLVGINDEQQHRLILMAQELDALNERKKAIAEQDDINAQARDIAADLLSDEMKIQASYERRRDIVLANTEITGEAQTRLLMQLEEQRNEQLLAINAGYWERWLAAAENNLTSLDSLAGSTLENFSRSFGQAFESMIFDAQTLGEAVQGMAEGMARSVVAALGEMAAQWLAYQAVQMLTGKTTQASAAATMTANASAQSVMAGLNAFASTAAIPIVGPAMAPAAMAAATAVTAPMAATVSSLALSGMAHEGIDKIPQTGTWLLEKGERVTTEKTSAKLDRTLDEIRRNGSGKGMGNLQIINNGPPMNIRRELDGDQVRLILDMAEDRAAASATGDGKVGKAISRAYGLKRAGR